MQSDQDEAFRQAAAELLGARLYHTRDRATLRILEHYTEEEEVWMDVVDALANISGSHEEAFCHEKIGLETAAEHWATVFMGPAGDLSPPEKEKGKKKSASDLSSCKDGISVGLHREKGGRGGSDTTNKPSSGTERWRLAKGLNEQLQGSTLHTFIAMHGFNPINAFLTMEWLIRKPDRALRDLSRRTDHFLVSPEAKAR